MVSAKLFEKSAELFGALVSTSVSRTALRADEYR
jgi:hypothetical protein